MQSTDALSDELVHHLMTFVEAQADVASLLDALPPGRLSAPLRALCYLLCSLYRGRIVRQTQSHGHHLSFWPDLVLPCDIKAPDLIDALYDCMPLYTSVTCVGPRTWKALPPSAVFKVVHPMARPTRVFAMLQHTFASLKHVAIRTSLRNRKWADENLLRLSELLPRLPQLQSLDLDCTSPRVTPGILALLRAVFCTPRLTTLCLQTNTWHEDLDAVFAAWMAASPVASLDFCSRFPSDAPTFLRAIATSRTLTCLRVGNFRDARNLFLAKRPLEWSAPLSELDVNLEMTPNGHSALNVVSWVNVQVLRAQCIGDAAPIALALAQPSALQHLHLMNGPLVPAMYPVLNARLARLVALCLTRNTLGDDGIRTLAAAFSTCLRLEQLTLSEQGMTDRGVTVLAESLVACRSLRVLNMAHNAIGSDGFLALRPILPRLTHLELQYNCIGHKAAMALRGLLPQTAHFRCLDMSANPLGRIGVLAMVAALKPAVYRSGRLLVSVSAGDDHVACTAARMGLRDPDYIVVGAIEPGRVASMP
ncbi:hypothetical protein SDRG_12056 [Saprolegnia diclina VS20]|uniref:F-box domain-containing protein n=1 Tax=Saprolegnia diclina (strain VS20) TaxID=1156394 RepID=T0PXE5_SAPDV|nr:hypothetical protein SDRG_12056 [Saprolegnia diclina VS20]EQC30204.1 hypothetical protein SDRG_12056 [Saprolegnia diclina VS20]|eukprot:XP_008616336.1 hypothetical protein SDRG_12056 [Saprolegnia diclina VS20]